MNFENIFILPNVIGDRTRRRFEGIFIKIPKVTSAQSSLVCTAFTALHWRALHCLKLPLFGHSIFPRYL